MAKNEKLLALLDRLSDIVDAIRAELEDDCRDSEHEGDEEDEFQASESHPTKNADESLPIVDIVSKIEDIFGLKDGELFNKQRAKKEITQIRYIAIYLCREMTRASLLEIAGTFGLKDHTTVIHAQRKIAEQLKTDAELQRVVENVKNKLSE